MARRRIDEQHGRGGSDHAKKPLRGTAGDLLSLIPGPDARRDQDPFLALSGRAALCWLALFAHAKSHGSWNQPEHPELGGPPELAAHWTVQGLAYACGTDRVTAGKGLKELVESGWVRRVDSRNRGQFGGLTYTLTVPWEITQAVRFKTATATRKKGVEYEGFKWRKASRILSLDEIKRIEQDVDLELETEQADLRGNEEKAAQLCAQRLLRRFKTDSPKQSRYLPGQLLLPFPPDDCPASDVRVDHQDDDHAGGAGVNDGTT